MANKSVILFQSLKIGRRWVFRPVDEDSSRFPNGQFYVSWYDGKKKQIDPVGRDPEHALRMANRKRAALAYVSAGGEIKQADNKTNLESAHVSASGEGKRSSSS